MGSSAVTSRIRRMQPSKSVSMDITSEPRMAARARERDLIGGQEHDGSGARAAYSAGPPPRCRGGGAPHGSQGLGLPAHVVHLRDERRHAEILERAGVAVSALLHPEVLHARFSRPRGRPRRGWSYPRTSRRCPRRGCRGAPIPSWTIRRSRRATRSCRRARRTAPSSTRG